MYKLRFYKQHGKYEGNFDHEEYFSTKEEMNKRYYTVFKHDLYSLNPTKWKEDEDGEWERMKEGE